ncbi:hypothetical protein MnTg02_01454 [bacterium MnTg02]|nr:hypothetical protein MnTg02_01454 [bacterium MnTg02]
MRILLICLSLSCAVILLVIGGVYVLFALAFWEPDGVEPGSVAYLFAIPSTAKDFPLWRPCGQATYSSRFQDGMSPETYWIEYKTRLSGAAFERRIAGYAKAQGCTVTPHRKTRSALSNTELGMACGTGSRKTQLAFSRREEAASACRPIRVLFIEDLH